VTTQMSLASLVEKYFEKDPVAAARSLETMHEDEAAEVISALTPSTATEAVRRLNDAHAAAVLQKVPRHLFRRIVQHIDAPQAAGLFLQLPYERRGGFLDLLEDKKKREIQEFISYPEDSAGRIMTTDLLAFHGDIKVKDALQKIRQRAQKGMEPLSYLYVVDNDNRLVGVLNMRDMILATGDEAVEDVMRKDVFHVHCFADRERVAHELSESRFFCAPVVDNQNRLLGVVNADRLLGGIQLEASEDIQKMFGAGGDEKAFSPIWFSLKTRLPWLHVNLATAFMAAAVVAVFEDIIAKITVLAIYLPVVAGQGGNAGAQSLAVVMRGLVMREIPPEKAKNLILKETVIGIVNGIVIGVVTGLIAWVWQGNPYMGLVIGLGMLVNLTIAGATGAIIPLAMKAIRLDPAQCSSIILTTVTDVMGFVAFLGFAVIFQEHLI